ncbi:hypothetical protein CSPB12327_00735 [Campylobacter sp. RM12327]|uniref:hypothetical protein n=1 Tax=Campylobacter sputorum TaxID=206 RepID=UPI000B77BEAF|nr:MULTISPECIES: hypothetical protein [Campylobacter]ASM40355.1 hypothetical protein CSPB_1153 [Campylobacter sputorum]MBE7357372.1 hypothetical protein [Campylobacter sp. RM11302]MBF6668682.1 hypothetical protein [Campylobacter sp. RM12327]MBF6674062.1 hypothetical protein [Campylobacter sp. RM13538]MBF6675531.1 hypothetical protein [Campylobacter sp. RM12321]
MLLKPYFAPILTIVMLCIFYTISMFFEDVISFYKVEGGLDFITYFMYFLSFFIVIYYKSAFKKHMIDFYLFMFLFIVAFLRESGAQSWIPSKDTTAFKIRFFTNPDNPLIEKIVSLIIIVVLLVVVGYLLKKYFVKIFKGFFKFDTLYLTVVTFGVIGILSKIADRFPSIYNKVVGVEIQGDFEILLLLIEEGLEAMLPALFAIGVMQYFYIQKQNLNQF